MDKRVVFLCTGNICRSPLAEGLARMMFGELGLIFASAGLAAPEGQAASPGSCLYARECGVSLAAHRSRAVTPAVVADAQWAIGMTRSHAALFKSRWGASFEGRIGVLGAPGVDLAVTANSPVAEEVADPYGGSDEVYRRTGEQIRRLLAAWSPEFRRLSRDPEGPDRERMP